MARSSYLDERGRIRSPVITRPDDRTPIGTTLPRPGEIEDAEAAVVLAIFRQFGLAPNSADDYRAALKDVERLHPLAVRTPAWEEIEERLWGGIPWGGSDSEQARRMVERYNTLEAVKEDPKGQLLMRISEGDENVCENCWDIRGATGTLADHEAIGLPGAESCLGMDRCRCVLVAVDVEEAGEA